MREPGLRLLAGAFLLVSMAWGGTVTFIPVALPQSGLSSAAPFLLAAGIFRAAGRFASGILADRTPIRAVLIGSLTVTVVGLAALPLPPSALSVLTAGVLYGLGSGCFQTSVYIAMLDRVASVDFGAVSALWNTSIDLGGVVAALFLAGVAAAGGYGAVMVALPVIVASAVPPVALLSLAQRQVAVR